MHGNPYRGVDAVKRAQTKAVTAPTTQSRTAARGQHDHGGQPRVSSCAPIFLLRAANDDRSQHVDWVTQEIAKSTNSLFNFAKRRLRNDALAEDAVHDTILAALEGVDRFAGQSSVRTWLIGILKHKISDLERRTSREILAPMDLVDCALKDPAESSFFGNDLEQMDKITPERIFESRQLLAVCERVLSQLPQMMRDVFMLRVVHDLNADETCRELGITPANLWVLQHRARVRLREDLAAYRVETTPGFHVSVTGRTIEAFC